jgi:hypothetical protein
MFIYRNYHGWNQEAGNASWSTPGTILGYESDSHSIFNGGGKIPFNILRHEYSHLLFGSNNFHASGSHSAGGTTFIPDQKGWSMMGGSESSFQTCNAWDRDRLDWKGPGKTMNISALDVNSTEVNGDLDATNVSDAGVYILRDFITTGDALRIKLPFIPSIEYQEYIWIENHQTETNNGSENDAYIYEDKTCMSNAIPGLYMYLQAGKDIKTGSGIYSNPSIGQAGHYLRFLPADGMYDVQWENSLQQNFCVGWGNWFYPFEKQSQYASPLTGAMDLENVGFDNDGNNKIYRAEDREFIIEKIGSQYHTELPYLGHSRHAFTLNGNHKIGVGTNPSSNSMMTFERGNISAINSGRDNRVVRLNGVEVTILEELANGTIKVEVKFDKTKVENDVRWCGNIELNAINGVNGYSLNLAANKIMDIDQGYTPTKIDNPMTINGEKYFVEKTLFTCLDQSYFHVVGKSTVNVINGSTLHLKAGSKLELEGEAKLYIGAGSKLIIDDGAILYLKQGAILEIDENAIVEYNNNQANKGLIVGETSYTTNPAKVLVKGAINFSSSAKWEHLRDGLYQFYPTHTLSIPSTATVKFIGKGKTRKMIGLEDNTTLSFTDNDIDWYNGLIEYSDNSKIEMIGVDFRSLVCTYNPTGNPTSGSKGLVIDNPSYKLFIFKWM